ncbi:NAD(P)-binding domain-containing protein [Nocardioides euryhalodurans]|uniref:Flavoprotein n=1 Tax=Nocardioides euryhalodurans TaxID=2518370 RepID=A0A4P7GNJ2_9ACTN|nr:NAD(P)-binding domain-containing protein [Nocardioides euryhalodurans]QBR93347.1 flavoprotein [Nocardioides euryhalodurans]
MVHPVVVIGAGPIGLAAAAHARSRGLRAVVLEAGAGAGASVREWGHVRLFSPWSELLDPVSVALLEPTGWVAPAADSYPTGDEWVERYLEPLAAALGDEASVELRFRHRVTGVARQGRDVMVDAGRESEPFVVHVTTPEGPARFLASAVVDASGTWTGPNPLGADGYPADGEHEHAEHIHHGMPDVDDPAVRDRYAGRHVVVAGTGASAQNALVALARLAVDHPDTRVTWLVRRAAATFGGGDNDQLAERGALGRRAQAVAESSVVTIRNGFRTTAVREAAGRLAIESVDGQVVTDVDEVVVVTGFRPDLGFVSEVRLDLDPVLQAPRALAPLIDPNVHSCGTVYPHGARELAHPEQGFYLAGMKSYGRAPSFLTLTGFEQVRSIVAAIDGDTEAAERVELVLPETGVCGGAGQFDEPEAAGGCCGTSVETELLTISSR